jgi:hypothetical protein
MAGGKVVRGLPTAFSISNPEQLFAAGHAACFDRRHRFDTAIYTQRN